MIFNNQKETKYFLQQFYVILIAFIALIDICTCQQLVQQSITLLKCLDHQYIDSDLEKFECKFCNSMCNLCINQDECLTCNSGYSNKKTCLYQDQKCGDGFIFDENQQACIKCKTDFCKECNQNGLCIVCNDGFIKENYKCLQKQDADYSELEIACQVGSEEKSGQCFEKSVCPSEYYKNNELQFKNSIQAIEIKDKIIIISQESIHIYLSQDLSINSKLFDISSDTSNKIITAKITKNYLIVLSYKFIYQFDAKSFKFINTLVLQLNNQNSESYQKFLYSNQESDKIYYLSILSGYKSLRVAHIEITSSINISDIKEDYILLDKNTQKLSLVTFFENQKIIIATNQSTIIIINLNKIDLDNKEDGKYFIPIPFEISQSIQRNDQILLEKNKENIILFISKQTNEKQFILKVDYNEQTNEIMQTKIQEIEWKQYLKSQSYAIEQITSNLQQINDKLYIISQITYKFSQKHSTELQLFLLIADLYYFFHTDNQDLFYYQSNQIKHWSNSNAANLFLVQQIDNLNKLNMITAVNGQIQVLQILNRSDYQPRELQQKIFYVQKQEDVDISFQLQNSEKSNVIIRTTSQLIILSLKELSKGYFSFKQNEQTFNQLKEVYFQNGVIYQVVVPQYLISANTIRYSFIIVNYKNKRSFEVIQTVQDYFGEIKVHGKTMIYFQGTDYQQNSILEDSFCSEQEQIIYVLTSKGIYIIEFHSLRQINFIPLLNYMSRNQNIIMSVISNFSQNNNKEQVFNNNSLVLMKCEKGKCEVYIQLYDFDQNYFPLDKTSNFFKMNPNDISNIYVQHQDQNQLLFNKIFVGKQEIILNLQAKSCKIQFLSEVQFGFFIIVNSQSTKAVRITINNDGLGEWNINENETKSYSFQQYWICEQLDQKRFAYCIVSSDTEEFLISLFDWNKVSLVSNTKDKNDNNPIQYLNIISEYGLPNFYYETSRVSLDSKKILLIFTALENSERVQNNLFIKIYFNPLIEIFSNIYDQQLWYIDTNSKIKEIPDSDFYISRYPLNQNHIRILFGDKQISGGYIGIEDNYNQDSFTYWKQDNSIIYQDQGQALVLKRQGQLKIPDTDIEYSDEEVILSQKLGYIVRKADTIQFISMDTYDIQREIKLNITETFVLYWSEKYLTLLIFIKNFEQPKLIGYDLSNNFRESVFEYSFEKAESFLVCDLLKIHPIFVCNWIGIYDFKLKKFTPKQNIQPLKLSNVLYYQFNLESKQYFFSGVDEFSPYGGQLIAVYDSIQGKFLEDKFLKFKTFKQQFFIHQNASSQISYIDRFYQFCGVLSISTFKIIKQFENVECFYLEQMQSLLVYQNKDEQFLYKLPVKPDSQPIITRVSNLTEIFDQNIKEIFIKNYFILIQQQQRNNYQITKQDIFTGETVFLNIFLESQQTYYKQQMIFWDEKNLMIFPNILISFDDKRYLQILQADLQGNSPGQQGDYSYRYNFILVKRITYLNGDLDHSVTQFISLDISEVFPFNQLQNDIYQTFKVKNVNYYFKNTSNLAGLEQKNDFIVLFNQKSLQITKNYLVEELKSELLFDLYEFSNLQSLRDIGYFDVYKTQYKIVQLSDDQSLTKKQIFGINIQCKLIFFEQNKVIQIIDLIAFQCEIELIENMIFLINRKDRLLIQLSFQNHQIRQLQIPFDIQNNLNVFEIRLDEQGRWILLLTVDEYQYKQNEFQIIRNNQKSQISSLIKMNSSVTSNYFFYCKNQQYLLIGLENSSVILYSLNYLANDSQQIMKMVQIQQQFRICCFYKQYIYYNPYLITLKILNIQLQTVQIMELKKGIVYNFRVIIQTNQSNLTKVKIFITTKYRIIFYQKELNLLQQLSDVQLDFKNSELTHTRSNSVLKILGDQFIAVISSIQITIYSLSLQYICRMEEKTYINVNDVILAPDNKSFIVTDNGNIYHYNILKINERERLILQVSQQYNYPIIYKVENIQNDNKSKENFQFMIYGAAVDTFIQIRQQYFTFEQNQDCLRYLNNVGSLEKQSNQYYQILTENQNSQNKLIQLAINIHTSQQILLPDFIFDENTQYLAPNTISLEIDLQKNVVELKQQLIYNKSFLKQLKITNGIINVTNSLLFQDMEQIEFKNVIINQQRGFNFNFKNIIKVAFDNITIQDQRVELNIGLLNEVYLYSFINIQNIFIRNLNIMNSIFKTGLFCVQQSNKINLNKITIKDSSFNLNYPVILFQDQNMNIEIKQINIKASTLIQLFNFKNSQIITISDVDIQQLNKKQEEVNRILDINEQESLNNEENNIQQICLINIINTQNHCSLLNFTLTHNQLNILLSYANYNQKIQDTSQNQVYTIDQSLSSNLIIQNIHVESVEFKQKLLDVKENNIYLRNITLIDNQNCQCYFYNSQQEIQIESFFFLNNKLKELPLLRIENSIINIQTLQINNTQVTKQQNNVQTNGLIFIYFSNFTITDMIGINNGQSDYFIFIDTYFDEIGQSSIHNSKILNTKGGGIMALNLKKFTISYCQIENNIGAEKGGGLYLGNVRVSILMNVQIKYNIARLSGGGIYLEESDLQIWKCTLQNNSAQIGGGIRYNNTVISPYFLKQNHSQISQNNATIFGNEFCSFPHHLEVVELTEEEIKFMNVSSEVSPSTFKNAVSSIIQQYTIIGFKLYDENNEIINLYNETELSKIENMNEKLKLELDKYSKFQLNFLEDEKQALISNKNEDHKYYKYDTLNFFAFSKFIVHSGYSQNQQKPINMQIFSEEKFQINSPDNKYIQEYQLNQTFSLQFRKCEKGEIIQKYQEDYYICWKCTQNTFSLDDPYLFNSTSQLKCQDCPFGAQNCTGNEIRPSEGFWIEQGFDSLYECINTEFACIYNQETKSSCIEGYYGPLCESCDYENKQWGRSKQTGEIMKKYAKKGKFKCTECSDRISLQNQIALSLVIGLLFIAYLAYQITSNLESKKLKYQAIYLKKSGLLYISNTLEQNEKSSVLIKIILSYMQLIVVINGFPINIPEFLKVTLNVGNLLESTAYSVDCLFVNMGYIQTIPIVYLRLFWTLIQPILYIIILSIIFAIIVKIQKKQRKRNLIISGLLKVYYMIFPSIIQNTVKNLSCKEFNSKSYILNDLQYECYDQNYFIFNFTISLPFLVIFVLIPYFLYRQLKSNSHLLKNNLNIYLSYGYFFVEFKKSYCFWEVIRLYEKILTYIIIGFFNQDHVISSLFMSLIIILYMKLQIELQPYTFSEFNKIDFQSQLTAIITILCMVINSITTEEFFKIITLLIVIIANIFFFYSIVKCFLSNILPTKVLQFKKQIQEKLNKSYPKLFSKPKNIIVNVIKVTQNWKKVKKSISQFKSQSVYHIQLNPQKIPLFQNKILTSIENNFQKKSLFKQEQIDKCLTNADEDEDKNIIFNNGDYDENQEYENTFQNINSIKLQKFNSNKIISVDHTSKTNLNSNVNTPRAQEYKPKNQSIFKKQ